MGASSSHAATQDKGKGPMVEPSAPPALHMLNQVNNEVINDPQLQINDPIILIPFTIGGDVHCFIGPIENPERANKKLSFFPSAQGEDLLINQNLDVSFFINQKPFKNNPKINPRGTDFTAWHERLAPTKSANRTTNNFYLPYEMIGMSLSDVAAITWLSISPPDFTSDMQPRHQYNIAPTNSYSDFIAHHMGAEGIAITDDEHVAFLFYWLNAVIFCSRSVQMSKFFLPLAALLHEGNNLNLAKLLLWHIFEDLGQFVNCLQNNYLISTGGPF
ncbi:hypothetical protein Ahy_A06g029160 [Arachis hypogaea]|uniref:Aminotransferase-like plant mobile domain-containing protein n=1 Tax=Arachis hypogaea TaxID=3818 RepID=A0A445CSQ2_ARAHY|nr:hypothetical protein Ahy_A06g029160 [Arachis hypogaea]